LFLPKISKCVYSSNLQERAKFGKFGLQNSGKSINQIRKILVIRFSSLGDVLLTTPVVRALKEKYPDAGLHFLVKKEFSDVFTHNPSISRIIVFDKTNEAKLKSVIAEEKYDLIIDLQNNWRSRKLTRGIASNIFMFVKPTLAKLLLVYLKVNLLKESKSIVRRYAEAAGVEVDQNGLELFLPQEIEPKLEPDKKYIGIAPGAKHFTKRWPQEYFVELGKQIANYGFIVVLFGGKSDRELCAEISSQIPGSINLQNDDILLQTGTDMKLCKLIVTNDSGLMHTAASVGVPVVAFFGSTVKEFGFAPYRVQNLILENNSLFCRPCSHIGKSNCPKKHFKCMKDVTPHNVLNHPQNFLSRL
jgi:heptosyltransferase-2